MPDSSPVQHDQHDEPVEASSASPDVTHISRRTDLSLLYRFVRVLIRPLRPKLVGFEDPYPAGSPQLKKHPKRNYGVHTRERHVCISSTSEITLTQTTETHDPCDAGKQCLYLYDFVPPRSTDQEARDGAKREHRHTVYYFAGGGFQSPASGEHWKLCARMARDLAQEGIKVVLVSYPLAPHSPAKDSIPTLRAWLLQTLKETVGNGRAEETVTLMGDSAGGNVVISLGFWWAEHLSQLRRELSRAIDPKAQASKQSQIDTLKHLKSVLALSPPTDFRNTNPEIAVTNKFDPVLTMDITNSAAEAWCKDWPYAKGSPKADPVLSPALATPEMWQAMRNSGLQLDGLFGTADVLAPDAGIFMEACRKERVRGSWLVWEKQMHCFPLTVCYGLSEGREGFEWCKERVKEAIG